MAKVKHIPKIAIITRTSNRPILLRRALESVRAQTLQDYIHVIVNDGGDESSLKSLLEEYNDNRHLLIHNSSSRGLVATLNQGIRAIESRFVTILDDDDSWPVDRLEKTVDFLDATGASAVVVPMDIIYEEINKGEVKFISQVQHPDSGNGEISLYKQCQKNYISNGIVTYRREVYDEIGGYDETLKTAEDWDFGIRLLLKYDVELLKNDRPLFYYHQRPKQKGPSGNSVHADVYQQERTINILRNRYLRDDLIQGKLGVGYIMNHLAQDAVNVVRLEGHMNYVGDGIRRDIRRQLERAVLMIRENDFMRIIARRVRSFTK